MRYTSVNVITTSLLCAALFSLAACSNPSAPSITTTSKTTTQPGVPGGIRVDTHTMTANVTAIDTKTRTVTLATPDGKKTPVQCGPEIVNFDKFRVGDQLRVVVTDEVAVYMSTEPDPAAARAVAVVALAPEGAKPGGMVATTVEVTATVTAIDLATRRATLEFLDGSTRSVVVRDDVDLTKRKVGEKVTIRTTGVVAVSLERP